MKCDGTTCWVAPSSGTCLAINSSDTAPVLCALGARLRLESVQGERVIDAKDLFRKDGIHYLSKRPDEILTDILLPQAEAGRSAYLKLRRRGAFDFPVLGVAVWLQFEGRIVTGARVFLNAVSMSPLEVLGAQEALLGHELGERSMAAAGDAAFAAAKPMDNADFHLHWRKEMARRYVLKALEEVRPR
jgi:4-hydroxybenzoyl-CoA reductase subunit beta